ncbi:MAG: hypothetical protein QFC55_05965 [Chloroflexota bacterium]|nr:hypothetical protein [Chloroflexota bacterium]
MLSKVPEIVIWFWVIKILCTTVGETFADWINTELGVGLVMTAVIFTVVMAGVLLIQMRLPRYMPFQYWLTVVVLSITGTLYTDILTDQMGVPLGLSSAVFAIALAVVFSIWYSRERTLSIHHIHTTPREAFYWLAVLVTFALGTALGDWTLELTGWGPGPSILLPAALLAIVTLLWRFGLNSVLAFWIAYILTRPLGANLGDYLGLPQDQGGLGLGTLVTSFVFLGAILAIVVYLTITKADKERETDADLREVAAPERPAPVRAPAPVARRRMALGMLGVVALATFSLLAYTSSLPHQSALADEGAAPTCTAGSAPLTQDEARAAVLAHFPTDQVSGIRSITLDTLALVQQGDQTGAAAQATELETAWDDDQQALNSADCHAWSFVDQQIDPVLRAVRAAKPDPSQEVQALNELLATLPAA